MAISMPRSRIRHITFLVIWRKRDPVGSKKAICNTSNLSCSRLESIDKGREIRLRSPSASISVSRISEPDTLVLGMYDNVIYRIECTTVEIADDGVSLKRRLCGHVNDGTGNRHVALLTKY